MTIAEFFFALLMFSAGFIGGFGTHWLSVPSVPVIETWVYGEVPHGQ